LKRPSSSGNFQQPGFPDLILVRRFGNDIPEISAGNIKKAEEALTLFPSYTNLQRINQLKHHDKTSFNK
jgi:hypothetical protein